MFSGHSLRRKKLESAGDLELLIFFIFTYLSWHTSTKAKLNEKIQWLQDGTYFKKIYIFSSIVFSNSLAFFFFLPARCRFLTLLAKASSCVTLNFMVMPVVREIPSMSSKDPSLHIELMNIQVEESPASSIKVVVI